MVAGKQSEVICSTVSKDVGQGPGGHEPGTVVVENRALRMARGARNALAMAMW